ncbi:MAG: M56 family metallopeptidase [Planctomycetaceae bacterium]|nr:M56 family metallopeptidase [Planctomycetaceae bacterium]
MNASVSGAAEWLRLAVMTDPVLFNIVQTFDMVLLIAVVHAGLTAIRNAADALFPALRMDARSWTEPVVFLLSAGLACSPLRPIVSAFVMATLAPLPQEQVGTVVPAVPMLVWAAGVVAGLVVTARELWHLNRWVRSRPAAPADAVFDRACRAADSRDVRLVASGPNGVLASWRVPGRRYVLVPDGFLAAHDDEARFAMYLHELTHIERRDGLVLMACRLARIVFWFSPWIRRAVNRMVNSLEFSCDRSVIERGVDRFRYAELILQAHEGTSGLMPGFTSRTAAVRLRLACIVGGRGLLGHSRKGLLSLGLLLAVVVLRNQYCGGVFREILGRESLVGMSEVVEFDNRLVRVVVVANWRGPLAEYTTSHATPLESFGAKE